MMFFWIGGLNCRAGEGKKSSDKTPIEFDLETGGVRVIPKSKLLIKLFSASISSVVDALKSVKKEFYQIFSGLIYR